MFSQIDLHVHVPDGATPKDGPSACVAMVSSLLFPVFSRDFLLKPTKHYALSFFSRTNSRASSIVCG
ncbi:MAG: hypothetical protein D3913_10160 [Candidatus Electrothrix sp. LOE1_4_5]|nr:hypothetical protein [Candidatus Electrothrix gigas]